MFKDKTYQENILNDIKIAFDGLRNLGICLAIGLSPQWLQEQMIGAGFSYELRGVINCTVLVMSIFSALAALYWTFHSFKVEPKSKWFNAFSTIILIFLALIVIATAIYTSYKHAPYALL